MAVYVLTGAFAWVNLGGPGKGPGQNRNCHMAKSQTARPENLELRICRTRVQCVQRLCSATPNTVFSVAEHTEKGPSQNWGGGFGPPIPPSSKTGRRGLARSLEVICQKRTCFKQAKHNAQVFF